MDTDSDSHQRHNRDSLTAVGKRLQAINWAQLFDVKQEVGCDIVRNDSIAAENQRRFVVVLRQRMKRSLPIVGTQTVNATVADVAWFTTVWRFPSGRTCLTPVPVATVIYVVLKTPRAVNIRCVAKLRVHIHEFESEAAMRGKDVCFGENVTSAVNATDCLAVVASDTSVTHSASCRPRHQRFVT